jgi:hypothetical protein
MNYFNEKFQKMFPQPTARMGSIILMGNSMAGKSYATMELMHYLSQHIDHVLEIDLDQIVEHWMEDQGLDVTNRADRNRGFGWYGLTSDVDDILSLEEATINRMRMEIEQHGQGIFVFTGGLSDAAIRRLNDAITMSLPEEDTIKNLVVVSAGSFWVFNMVERMLEEAYSPDGKPRSWVSLKNIPPKMREVSDMSLAFQNVQEVANVLDVPLKDSAMWKMWRVDPRAVAVAIYAKLIPPAVAALEMWQQRQLDKTAARVKDAVRNHRKLHVFALLLDTVVSKE